MVKTMRFTLAMAMMAGAASGVAARPDYPEVEPNETKTQATPVGLAAGDTLSGNTTGASTTAPGAASADTFLVQTATLAPGIYRNRLTLGATGHSATIRGWNQTAAGIGTTDTTIQTATSGMNQWYGFGKGEKIYYRVTGSASSTSDYHAALDVSPVTPTDLGTFQAGQIVFNTVAQGHTTDTDMWVYDSNFTAIPGCGNDDESIAGGGTGATLQSRLTRTYTAGTYYLALTSYNFANNLQSPPDDDFLLGAVLDFADAATNSSTTTNQNVAFAVIDGTGTTQFSATKPGAFDIVWSKFTVAGTVVTGACCFTDGSCQVLTSSQCSSQGGTYAGDNITCLAANCPQPPTGACCLPSNTCQVLTAAQCATQGGVYRGNASTCATANCPTVYIGTNLGVPITDGGPTNGTPGPEATATLNVPSSATISDIDVDFMITHTWQGDLAVKLVGPGGQSVDLVSRPGVAPPKFTPGTTAGFGFLNDNYGNATAGASFFADDQAPVNGIYDNNVGAPGVGTATAADNVSGRWKPVQPLSVFNGTNQQGDWKLIVTDNAAGDTGTLDQFSLHITTSGGGPVGCYANCDNSTAAPCLNVNDFVCFNTQYAAGSSYANCDLSTLPPILNVNDFVCFNTKFAAGCTNPCDPHP
jgi:subtilisin-like proprotein convertase family protein